MTLLATFLWRLAVIGMEAGIRGRLLLEGGLLLEDLQYIFLYLCVFYNDEGSMYWTVSNMFSFTLTTICWKVHF